MAKVVIDAGHGGSESGAVYPFEGVEYAEKTFNLLIAKEVRRFLQTVSPIVEVVMTREDDTTQGTCEKGTVAKTVNADLFVSIHNNAFVNNNTVCGTETLHRKSFTAGQDVSISLARTLQDTFIEFMNGRNWGVTDRGIKTWWRQGIELGVLRCSAPIPAALIECAYMTCPSDMEKLLNDEFKADCGYAIALGIVRWLNNNRGTNLSDPIREPQEIPDDGQEPILPIGGGILFPALLAGGLGLLVTYLILKGR